MTSEKRAHLFIHGARRTVTSLTHGDKRTFDPGFFQSGVKYFGLMKRHERVVRAMHVQVRGVVFRHVGQR